MSCQPRLQGLDLLGELIHAFLQVQQVILDAWR